MVHKVEQTTIKLLNNKGHLPSATSIKKVEISRWFNPGRDLPRLRWWGGGRSQRCYTQPHLILVENKFFGHTCREGNLLLFFKTCSKENPIGNTVRQQPANTNWPRPNDETLGKEEQSSLVLLLFVVLLLLLIFYFPLWILLFIRCGRSDSIGIMSLHRHIYLLSEEKHLCLLKLFLLDLVFAGSKEFCLACKVNTNISDRSTTSECPQSILVGLVKVTFIYIYMLIACWGESCQPRSF